MIHKRTTMPVMPRTKQMNFLRLGSFSLFKIRLMVGIDNSAAVVLTLRNIMMNIETKKNAKAGKGA